MNRFRIFKPQKGFYITNNMVVYSLFGLSLLLIGISKLFGNNTFLGSIGIFLVLGAIVLTVILGALSNFYYKPFRGELLDFIHFYNDRVEYQEEAYYINDTKSIEVQANDYSGLVESGRDCNWKISNGTGNAISLEFEAGKKIVYHFQMINEGDILNIKEQLIHYHLAGKISWLRLIEIVAITDYNEIQDFKKVVDAIKN